MAEHEKASVEVERMGRLAKNNSGAIVINPWLTIRDNAADRITTLSEKLGLTSGTRPAVQRFTFEQMIDDISFDAGLPAEG